MDTLKAILFWGKSEALEIKKHKKNIDIYNKSMTIGVVRIISIILFIASVTSPILEGFGIRLIICSTAFAVFLALYLACVKGVFDRCQSFAFYLSMSFGTVLAVILSVFAAPNQRAAILLGIFFIVPMAHIDYFNRKLAFSLFVFTVHTVLAIPLKGMGLTMVDSINSICFICIGSFIGHIMQKTKLTSFELRKSLIIERETDVLTGLKNRRKMIEMFGAVEEKKIPTPSCAILIDIDHFKQYNDVYGHTAGDTYLQMFGEMLTSFESRYKISFFRYGGEEFAAFMWGYSAERHKEILEFMRIAVSQIQIEHGRTISVGYIDCFENDHVNLEDALALADIALYQAKHGGRNQVVRYDSSMTEMS